MVYTGHNVALNGKDQIFEVPGNKLKVFCIPGSPGDPIDYRLRDMGYRPISVEDTIKQRLGEPDHVTNGWNTIDIITGAGLVHHGPSREALIFPSLIPYDDFNPEDYMDFMREMQDFRMKDFDYFLQRGDGLRLSLGELGSLEESYFQRISRGNWQPSSETLGRVFEKLLGGLSFEDFSKYLEMNKKEGKRIVDENGKWGMKAVNYDVGRRARETQLSLYNSAEDAETIPDIYPIMVRPVQWGLIQIPGGSYELGYGREVWENRAVGGESCKIK